MKKIPLPDVAKAPGKLYSIYQTLALHYANLVIAGLIALSAIVAIAMWFTIVQIIAPMRIEHMSAQGSGDVIAPLHQ